MDIILAVCGVLLLHMVLLFRTENEFQIELVLIWMNALLYKMTALYLWTCDGSQVSGGKAVERNHSCIRQYGCCYRTKEGWDRYRHGFAGEWYGETSYRTMEERQSGS